jgi:hypothetical protein
MSQRFSLADIKCENLKYRSRHTPVIEPVKEAAGYQPAWALKFVWGVAISKVSADFS